MRRRPNSHARAMSVPQLVWSARGSSNRFGTDSAFIRALLEKRKDPSRSATASRMASRAGTPSTPPPPPPPEHGHILEPWSEAFNMVGASSEDTPAGSGMAEELNEFAVNSLAANNDFWETVRPHLFRFGQFGLSSLTSIDAHAVNLLICLVLRNFKAVRLCRGFGGPLVGLAGGNGLMFSGEMVSSSFKYGARTISDTLLLCRMTTILIRCSRDPLRPIQPTNHSTSSTLKPYRTHNRPVECIIVPT